MRQKIQKRTVYNFKNTCGNCYNDIEIPLLGPFSEGEQILQTNDGQDFLVATLIDNMTLAFIKNTINNDNELKNQNIDPIVVLTQLADNNIGKCYTRNFPICPICRNKLSYYSDIVRTGTRELDFADWQVFENLTMADKVARLREVSRQS